MEAKEELDLLAADDLAARFRGALAARPLERIAAPILRQGYGRQARLGGSGRASGGACRGRIASVGEGLEREIGRLGHLEIGVPEMEEAGGGGERASRPLPSCSAVRAREWGRGWGRVSRTYIRLGWFWRHGVKSGLITRRPFAVPVARRCSCKAHGWWSARCPFSRRCGRHPIESDLPIPARGDGTAGSWRPNGDRSR